MEGCICREGIKKQLDAEVMEIAFAHVETLKDGMWLCKESGDSRMVETAVEFVAAENEGVEVWGVGM